MIGSPALLLVEQLEGGEEFGFEQPPGLGGELRLDTKNPELTERINRRARRELGFTPDRFLCKVIGVIHVGANTGQEREGYRVLGLQVLWVEPIPHLFEEMVANIESYDGQKAVRAVVTYKNGEVYEFHIASNKVASSSILELKLHKEVWPDVEFERTISLRGKILVELLAGEGLLPSGCDSLIPDTQGSELLVLKGAESILGHFKFIKTAVADFEAYSGCCLLGEMDEFMRRHGFRRIFKSIFARREGGGAYLL